MPRSPAPKFRYQAECQAQIERAHPTRRSTRKPPVSISSLPTKFLVSWFGTFLCAAQRGGRRGGSRKTVSPLAAAHIFACNKKGRVTKASRRKSRIILPHIELPRK